MCMLFCLTGYCALTIHWVIPARVHVQCLEWHTSKGSNVTWCELNREKGQVEKWRGLDPSPTLKVLAILEIEARKTLRKVLDIP